MRAISIHALERLQERRQLQHFLPHIHKIQRWGGLQDDGIFEHKGWRYVMREGVLITVLPPTREFRRQNKEDELCHRMARIMMICPKLFDSGVKEV